MWKVCIEVLISNEAITRRIINLCLISQMLLIAAMLVNLCLASMNEAAHRKHLEEETIIAGRWLRRFTSEAEANVVYIIPDFMQSMSCDALLRITDAGYLSDELHIDAGLRILTTRERGVWCMVYTRVKA